MPNPQVTSPSVQRPHYAALDGLRGFAILLVFCSHYCDMCWGTPPHRSVWYFGWVGVDLFFVLSGFLITGILYDSRESGRFFRNFYVRRTLRVFPLYYATWLVCLLLTPFVFVGWNRYVLAQAFYVGNLTLLGALRGQHPDPGLLTVGHSAIVFGHYWSLCIEEQFYLVWPFVVYFVRNRTALLRTALGGAAAICLLRCAIAVFSADPIQLGVLYNVPYGRFDSLLIGGAVALWLRGLQENVRPSPRLYGWMVSVPLVLLAVIVVSTRKRFDIFLGMHTLGFTLLAIAAAGALLAALDDRTRWHRFLLNRHLASLGVVSYGFYVLHAIPMRILDTWRQQLSPASHRLVDAVGPFVALAFFYGLARLSYRFIESPFLRLKDKLAPAIRQPDVSRALHSRS